MVEFGLGALVTLVTLYIVNRIRRWNRTETPSEWSAEDLYRVVSDELTSYYQKTADPGDLRTHPAFQKAVRMLSQRGRELTTYVTGDNEVLACVALEAMSQVGAATEEYSQTLLSHLNILAPWPRYFALNALRQGVPKEESLVGPLLLRLDGSWGAHPNFQFLWAFIQKRVSAGERITFGDLPDSLPEDQLNWLEGQLQSLGVELVGPLIKELRDWRHDRIDVAFLNSIGRVWDEQDSAGIIEHAELERAVASIQAALGKEPPRSVLLIGERGVGKTAIVRHLARCLRSEGWHLFEAGHSEMVAGQVYVGQLEERLRSLLERLSSTKPIAWYVPDFHLFSWTGRSYSSPVSILTTILHMVERGNLRIVGETTPSAYERLIQSNPRCRTAFERIQVEPLDPGKTLDLAREVLRSGRSPEASPLMSMETLSEARELASQYLGNESSPGNLLEVLKSTRERVSRLPRDAGSSITIDDLIVTLAGLTGLPLNLLDDRRELDLKNLREFFERRVMGQVEAVNCLVERVAMIKAGVVDPSRPYGVFLFAGPTGTGKTQIAKTLAEALFGSTERMIRLDMSEYQNPDSVAGIIGDPPNRYWADQPKEEGGALVEKIRQHPFSVVLLDEFEKAHPRIWNLFLQVFDDGRLTDTGGSTADFRHALFILTSNLGSAIPTGLRMGFTDEPPVFSPGEVRQAIRRTFSKELLNRLDRVVVFRPLSRDTIREILQKEIEEAFHRRGLRHRSWAVVWDDDSLEFLIEKGFTVDMGARPLKRAVERHLLTPLATSIVNRGVPEGEQFLLIQHREGRLDVEFVDPDVTVDEPVTEESAPDVSVQDSESPDLASILLSPRGTADEIRSLEKHLTRLGENLGVESWQQNKQSAFDLMAQPDFWSSPERFSILGELEYLDRMEAGFDTAGILLDQLKGSAARGRDRVPRQLTERLAQQLFLLEAAWETVRRNEPRDAFLRLEAAPGSSKQNQANNEFALRLSQMYRNWARKRRMKLTVLRESPDKDSQSYEFLAAVSGFGAYVLLAPEQGLQVLESPGADQAVQRATVRVWVWPQPDQLAGPETGDWARQADEGLPEVLKKPLSMVRRYQEDPSPLVRDNLRKWRTGRIDRVLDGDFDLLGYTPAPD